MRMLRQTRQSAIVLASATVALSMLVAGCTSGSHPVTAASSGTAHEVAPSGLHSFGTSASGVVLAIDDSGRFRIEDLGSAVVLHTLSIATVPQGPSLIASARGGGWCPTRRRQATANRYQRPGSHSSLRRVR